MRSCGACVPGRRPAPNRPISFFDRRRTPAGDDAHGPVNCRAPLGVGIFKEFIVRKSQKQLSETELEQCLLQAVSNALDSQQLTAWQVGRVTQYVEDNLGARIRVADLAAATKLSKSHFARCFRASFGMAPYSYVTLQRIRRAHELLAFTTASLSTVALDCGLVDQSHLTNQFRRHTGTTPGRWRRDYDPEAAPLGCASQPGKHLSAVVHD